MIERENIKYWRNDREKAGKIHMKIEKNNNFGFAILFPGIVAAQARTPSPHTHIYIILPPDTFSIFWEIFFFFYRKSIDETS